MPQVTEPTGYEVTIAPAAALLADEARAAMMAALLAGRPLAASELARVAAVSAPTASAHLAKLLDGGMVSVVRQGRYRYYQLGGHEVAAAIEALAQIGRPARVRSLRQSRQAVALAEARTCYDHLAGRAGVALLDGMLQRRLLTEVRWGRAGGGGAAVRAAAASSPAGSGPAGNLGPNGGREAVTGRLPADMSSVRYEVTRRGEVQLGAFGIQVDDVRAGRRRFAGACLDWTQRQPHLGGALAAAITARLFGLGWIERGPLPRSVLVTDAGRAGLAGTLGWIG